MKKNNCVYCGKNPVPHFINWYFESVNILLAPLRSFLIYNPFSLFFKKLFNFLNLSFRIVQFGSLLGIISFRNNVLECKVRRAQVLWEEAVKRGIKMKELLLFGRPFDCYLAEKSDSSSEVSTKGGKNFKSKIVFSGLPRPINYNNSSLDWMDDKRLFKKMLQKNNLPLPKGKSVWNFSQARKIFIEIQTKDSYVIVKPRAGSRGRHSTTFVDNLEDLKKAYEIAKKLCFWVVVEEQLFGPVYRATLINYELCGCLRGDSPQVTGDGIHNIEELVKIKNNHPHPGVKDIVIDEEMERFIQRQFLKSALDYVPSDGEIVNLSEKIGVNYGGSSREDFEICHSDNKELFVRAAKVLGDPIVGFDFIIPDITRSWREQKCGFIEANSLPFINLHHDPLLGIPRNVAAKVWETVGM